MRPGERDARGATLAVLLALGLSTPSWAQSPPPNPPYPGKQPEKKANAPTVVAGGTITWTITIHNDYFDEDATTILADDVPDPADGYPVPNWQLPLPCSAPGPCGNLISFPSGSPTYNGDSLSILNLLVPGRQSRQVVFVTNVLASAQDGTQICNQAYIRYQIETCSGNPPSCGTFTYDSPSWPAGGTQAGPVCVTVTNPTLPRVVGLQNRSSLADSCPSDSGFPAPDRSISPGETLDLTLAIENQGGSDANASPPPITGTLLPAAGFTILSGTSPYSPNTLVAFSGNFGTNTNPFRIRVNPDVTCPGNLSLTVNITNITNGPYVTNFSFPITNCLPKCLNLRLSPEQPTFSDACVQSPPGSNGSIDPGEELTLQLPVRNAGPEDLRGAPTIRGTLSSLTAGVTVVAAASQSDYPDLRAGSSGTNLQPFRVRLDETLACGTPFVLRLALDNTEGGPRSVDFHLAVAAPCQACAPPTCSITAVATALSATERCENDPNLLTLDSASSTIDCGTGNPTYQWLESGSPIGGATGPTYDVPIALPPGSYSYQVQIGCDSQPCLETSAAVTVTVAPRPRVVKRLMAVKQATVDLVASWDVEPTATGGYHLYRTADPTLIPNARAGTAGVFPAGATNPNPNSTTLTDPGIVPPASGRKLYYQCLAVCIDLTTEGPN